MYRPPTWTPSTPWARRLDAVMRERDWSKVELFEELGADLGYRPKSRTALYPLLRDKEPSPTQEAKNIAWVAHLSEPAGATQLTVLVLKASGGSEKLITSESANVSPEWTVLGNRADVAGGLGRAPGTYILRYVRGDTILAEGRFKLVKG